MTRELASHDGLEVDEDKYGPYGGKPVCSPEDAGKPWCCCYDLGNDWYGPQFFFPPQCVRQTSFMIPRVASPNIAVIGKKGDLNYIEQDIADYWMAFKKI
jgi:hypothetical protein